MKCEFLIIQFSLLIYQLHENQMLFNRKIKSARDKKIKFVNDINRGIDRLEQIEYLLGEESSTKIERPQLKLDEVPEK